MDKPGRDDRVLSQCHNHFVLYLWSFYEVRTRRGERVDRLLLREKVTSSGGAVCPPVSRHLPQNLEYECRYSMDCGGNVTETASLFNNNGKAQEDLVEVLALPAWELRVWDDGGDNSEWISVLQHRTQHGIVTQELDWMVYTFEELDSLFAAMPRDLQSLTLLFSCEDFADVNNTANVFLNYIDDDRLPDLTYINLRLDFPGKPLSPETTTAPLPEATPKWMNNTLPWKLLDIELTLICNVEGWDADSNFSSTDSEEGVDPEIEFFYNLEAPKEFILNVRRKLGEDFHIVVETLYRDRHVIKKYHRESYSYLDDLLYSPIEVAEQAYHGDDCDPDSREGSVECGGQPVHSGELGIPSDEPASGVDEADSCDEE